ncbi:hypothetical protein L345_11284, partial [Ophiophagus hannah]
MKKCFLILQVGDVTSVVLTDPSEKVSVKRKSRWEPAKLAESGLRAKGCWLLKNAKGKTWNRMVSAQYWVIK